MGDRNDTEVLPSQTKTRNAKVPRNIAMMKLHGNSYDTVNRADAALQCVGDRDESLASRSYCFRGGERLRSHARPSDPTAVGVRPRKLDVDVLLNHGELELAEHARVGLSGGRRPVYSPLVDVQVGSARLNAVDEVGQVAQRASEARVSVDCLFLTAYSHLPNRSSPAIPRSRREVVRSPRTSQANQEHHSAPSGANHADTR